MSADNNEPTSKYTDNPEGDRFTKLDGAEYDRIAGFLDDKVRFTPREWAIARLCQDFRTETGVEMTKIGENLPDLVPFMTDEYSRHAVGSAKASFDEKVRLAAATFLYGAMSGFYTSEELDDLMYESTTIAKSLLEFEGADIDIETETRVENRVSDAMREVHEASRELRDELDDE